VAKIRWSFGWFQRFDACSATDFGEAAIEVGVICLSAFIPLWAGLGIFALMTTPGAVGQYGMSFMTSGEMLLISCAVIGPMLYLLTKKYGNLSDNLTLRFPYSTGFSVLIVLIWFIAGGVFVVKKVLIGGPIIFDDNAMWYLSFGYQCGFCCPPLFRYGVSELDESRGRWRVDARTAGEVCQGLRQWLTPLVPRP
jgi:hypothetical protein